MYTVNNAIIMAAGMSSRFVPLCYEQPKALLKVKGEVLIERQIKQLKEAGITDITIVVGYMAEKFAYLKDKYQVELVWNPDYCRYNNTSSLMCVLDKISSTYICSSDNYFTENVFEKEVPEAYYAAVYGEGETGEYCLSIDEKGLITDVTIGGKDAWYMLGHVYFSPEFSEKFKEILVREYENMETRTHLWENLYMRYIEELPLFMRKYETEVIKEFDTLEELREFDDSYKEQSGSFIMHTIAACMGCKESEITNLMSLSGGLTNKNFRFDCKGKTYVYRHPGEGTEVLINRQNEKISTLLANKIGIDAKLSYFDEKSGVKIAEYIEDAKTMTVETLGESGNMAKVASVLRRLHTCGEDTGVAFDILGMAAGYEEIIAEHRVELFADYEQIKSQVFALKETYLSKETTLVPCHNDVLCANWVLGKDKIYLIDWEYAGMNHPMWDVADLAVEAEMNREQEEQLLQVYFEREATTEEKRVFMIYKVLIDFLWSLWGKARVPYDGEEVDQYAKDRYVRMKKNLAQIDKE